MLSQKSAIAPIQRARSGDEQASAFIRLIKRKPLLLLITMMACLCWLPLAVKLAQTQEREIAARPKAAVPKRVALVIGNGKYAEAPLANSTNDARQLAATLRQLNFDVVELADQNKSQMKQAIRAFGQRLTGAGEGSVAWFFYAGHGVQVNGRNYLIPIGADVTNEAEAEDECVNVELVLAQMATTPNVLNVVVLDACRNNPFRGWRSGGTGLAFVNAPRGTLIAYATAPGKTATDGAGKNSPYTAALLNQLPRPNLSLLRMFELVREEVETATRGNQTPWESTSVTNGSEFYLAGRANVARPMPSTDANGAELALWQSADRSNEISEFEEYLRQYPNGRFAVSARNRIAKLRTPAEKSSAKIFDKNDFVGTWECFEPTSEYQSGSGKIPPSSRLAYLADFSDRGVHKDAYPFDKSLAFPKSVLIWEYTRSSNMTGEYVLKDERMSTAARCRVKWINVDTFEDEIIYSNVPSYIGIKRVFKKIK